MQVLVPTTDIPFNASIFHDELLERQRYDLIQVVKALNDPDNRHFNHPVVRQWRTHDMFLLDMGVVLCTEWQARGRVDHLLSRVLTMRAEVPAESTAYEPEWWVDPSLHAAHQAYLVRKWPNRYKPRFPEVDHRLPMVYLGPENDAIRAAQELERATKARERAEQLEEEARERAKEFDTDD